MQRLLARVELRRQWRALVLLTLLVVVIVAGVVGTLVAADRSRRAFDRLRTATNATDVAVDLDFDDTDVDAAERKIGSVRGVRDVAAEAELFVRPAGTELFPDYNFHALASYASRSAVNRPVVVSGRLPDPDRVHEVAVSESLAADMGIRVGDPLALESMTVRWVERAFSGGDAGPPDGPRVRARVVGVVRSPADFGRAFATMRLTPAFLDRYGARMRVYRRIEAQVPEDPSAAFRRAIGEADPSPYADDGSTDDALATVATALRVIAAVAAVVGGIALLVAVGRTVRSTLRDRDVLRALGAAQGQLVGVALVVLTPVMVVGAAIGALLGTAVASHAMVGLAARIEPPGTGVVFAWGTIFAVVVAVVAIGLGGTVMAARAPRAAPARRRPLPRLLRLDRPLPVVLGLRRALVGDAEGGGRTSRVALSAMVLGLAGAVAALVVSASIGHLRSDPTLYGLGGSDRSIDSGESTEVYDAVMPQLAADRRIGLLEGLHISFDARVDGHRVTLLAVDHRRGTLSASVVKGRLPAGRDEVVLGPATLDRIGKRVGDRVRLDGPAGSARYRVVGSILFPEGDFTYDDGLAARASAVRRVVGDVHDTAPIHSLVYDWRPGVDTARADDELRAMGIRVFASEGGVEPARVTNLGQVDDLPKYLSAFLAVLALATLAHALAVNGRRRAREHATLSAIGLTARAGAGIVATQAAVVAAAALLLGVPLGVLIGDRIWTAVAEHAHVIVATALPGGWLAAVVAVTVVGVGLVSVAPIVRARRVRPAETLRAE